MNCRQAEKWIAVARDGLLSDRQQRRLARHLAQCSSCRQKQRDLERMGALLRALPEKPLPPGFQDRLMRHLASTGRAPKRDLYWVKPVSVAAAAVVLVAVVGLGIGQWRTGAIPPVNDMAAPQMAAQVQPEEADALGGGLSAGAASPEAGGGADEGMNRAAQPEALMQEKSAQVLQDAAACAGYLVQAPASRQSILRADLSGAVYTGEGLLAALLPADEAQRLTDRWAADARAAGYDLTVQPCPPEAPAGFAGAAAWMAEVAPDHAEALGQLGQALSGQGDGSLVVILLDEGA